MESTLVDLSPLLLQLLSVVGVAVLAIAGWAVKKVADKFGLENDAKIREYLLSAVERGVEFGKHKAEEKLGDANWAKIDVKNELVASAAGYVLKKVPDALKKFKLTEDDVKDLILSKLGASNEETAATKPAQASPVPVAAPVAEPVK